MSGRRRAPRRITPGRRTSRGRATAPVLLAGLALGALVLAGGCLAATEDSPRAVSPQENDAQPDPPAQSPSGAGASSPITFATAAPSATPSGQPGASRQCAEVAGEYLSYGLIDVSRPVTVEALDLPEAVGVQLGASWVAPRPKKGAVESGLLRGREPLGNTRHAVGWRHRRPLEGTLLGSGEWFVLTTLQVQHTGRANSLDLLWSDDLSTGVSSWSHRIEFRERCA